MEETTVESGRGSSRRTRIIVVAVVLALVAGGFGAWFAFLRPTGVQRADVERLDKQRGIVDSSMNLYDPLLEEFTARYTNVVAEEEDEQAKEQVFNRESDLIKRESAANTGRLDAMAASPVTQEAEIAEAFRRFKDQYGAVIAYNDQRLINTANITRSVGGPCAPLHKDLNVSGGNYAQEYVTTADSCLLALAGAKDKADADTVQLLGGIEEVIKGQRAKQQEVLDATDDLARLAKRTTAGVALLEINEALNKVRTTYEEAVKASSTKLVDDANASNAELERLLKARLATFDAAGKEGK
ncbi:UNVERIFIED_ORG: ferredoxin-thioredoxin reductase catalytic subunit [Paenarthrobacter nicotinovorans]